MRRCRRLQMLGCFIFIFIFIFSGCSDKKKSPRDIGTLAIGERTAVLVISSCAKGYLPRHNNREPTYSRPRYGMSGQTMTTAAALLDLFLFATFPPPAVIGSNLSSKQ